MRAVISQNIEINNGVYYDKLDHRFFKFFSLLNIDLYPFPNCLGKADNINEWLDKLEPQLIVLTGGNDLGSIKERDSTEKSLIDYAKSKMVPLLGICRGMQILAWSQGIDLKRVNGHVGVRHSLKGEIQRVVNSYHNFAMYEVPADYKILARAPTEEVEAIKHITLPILGVMWHPEREDPFNNDDLEMIQRLLE